jgi:hypothetical protein
MSDCRYARRPHEELVQAAAEQMRITERRLASLLGGARDAPAASAPPAGELRWKRLHLHIHQPRQVHLAHPSSSAGCAWHRQSPFKMPRPHTPPPASRVRRGLRMLTGQVARLAGMLAQLQLWLTEPLPDRGVQARYRPSRATCWTQPWAGPRPGC